MDVMPVRDRWRGPTDCKSVVERLRKFKSFHRHFKIYLDVNGDYEKERVCSV